MINGDIISCKGGTLLHVITYQMVHDKCWLLCAARKTFRRWKTRTEIMAAFKVNIYSNIFTISNVFLRVVKMLPQCFSVFISVKKDGRCFGQTSVIHGESKHVSLFPMWLWACLLTFNCSPNNAYWFLPKIFAHDWHFRQTWPVTGLLLTSNKSSFRLMTDKDLARLYASEHNWQSHVKLDHSIICSLSVFELYFEVPLHFDGLWPSHTQTEFACVMYSCYWRDRSNQNVLNCNSCRLSLRFTQLYCANRRESTFPIFLLSHLSQPPEQKFKVKL